MVLDIKEISASSDEPLPSRLPSPGWAIATDDSDAKEWDSAPKSSAVAEPCRDFGLPTSTAGGLTRDGELRLRVASWNARAAAGFAILRKRGGFFEFTELLSRAWVAPYLRAALVTYDS